MTSLTIQPSNARKIAETAIREANLPADNLLLLFFINMVVNRNIGGIAYTELIAGVRRLVVSVPIELVTCTSPEKAKTNIVLENVTKAVNSQVGKTVVMSSGCQTGRAIEEVRLYPELAYIN